jgi:high-affinity iron transporter
LGVFPSVETLLAQVAAIAFVIGSYVVATEVKVKRPQRRAARKGVPAPMPEPVEPPKEPVAS